MKNSDNGITFECENPILLHTRPVRSLLELKSLILGSVGGNGRKEIRRVGYRLLALMKNRIFQFCLFWLHGKEHVRLMFDDHRRIMVDQVMELFAEVGNIGGGGSSSSNFIQDDPSLTPPSIHVASLVEDMEVDSEDSDEEYVADSNESGSSEDDDEEEFVPETLVKASHRYLLPPPHPIPALSSVPNHYGTLDLDVMHEKNLFSNTGEEDYNLDGGVEFRIGHRFKTEM